MTESDLESLDLEEDESCLTKENLKLMAERLKEAAQENGEQAKKIRRATIRTTRVVKKGSHPSPRKA